MMSMDRPRDRHPLERRVARLTAAAIGLALLWAGTVLWTVIRNPRIPPVLAVERLEIREPDGELAFALANSARPSVGIMGGEVIMADQAEERRHPNFIFFDGNGDEVGGLMLRTTEGPDGPAVARFMTFDAHDQQETLVLGYTRNARGTTTSGLRIIDHPSGVSLLGALAKLGLEPGFTRAELEEAVAGIPAGERQSRIRELRGITRAVLGSTREGDVALTLHDGDGRPRIVLEVPLHGEAAIRVLDGDGETMLRLPR
jgi:hypothetical protein